MVSMSEHTQPQESWNDAAGQGAQANRSMPSQAGRSAGILGESGREILERTVKRDVIPRLVALPWITRSTPADLTPRIAEGSVGKLVKLCLDAEAQGVAGFVAELFRSGVGAYAIYEQVLTPAARRLGDMWEDDACTFADVTIGVLRLQNAQRAIAAHSMTEAAPALGAPRAFLTAMPGEQHTFGLSIVLDYFTRAGWDARLGAVGSQAELLAMVRNERTELVGLSIASDERVSDAKALIAAIRRASANKQLVVLVGGPPFMEDPTLAASVGADATAIDGHQAVLCANDLLHLPAIRA